MHDDDNDDRVAQHGGHTPKKRHSLGLPSTSLIDYWISILNSIDTCQNKASADQCHMTILRAQVYTLSRSYVFVKLTADQVLTF